MVIATYTLSTHTLSDFPAVELNENKLNMTLNVSTGKIKVKSNQNELNVHCAYFQLYFPGLLTNYVSMLVMKILLPCRILWS